MKKIIFMACVSMLCVVNVQAKVQTLSMLYSTYSDVIEEGQVYYQFDFKENIESELMTVCSLQVISKETKKVISQYRSEFAKDTPNSFALSLSSIDEKEVEVSSINFSESFNDVFENITVGDGYVGENLFIGAKMKIEKMKELYISGENKPTYRIVEIQNGKDVVVDSGDVTLKAKCSLFE